MASGELTDQDKFDIWRDFMASEPDKFGDLTKFELRDCVNEVCTQVAVSGKDGVAVKIVAQKWPSLTAEQQNRLIDLIDGKINPQPPPVPQPDSRIPGVLLAFKDIGVTATEDQIGNLLKSLGGF